jgi:glycosyltransferase involved in cell wall biosynthesis
VSTAVAADVRVYLFTYRRNHLLPRALSSLLAQTHTNWVCELHNDDPDDLFPGQLVAETNDPRITYVRHERNLGPTATFNHAFRPVRESFVSLLEDDNWWEPTMLARLLAAIRQHPRINVAWVNSHLWRETSSGEWERAGTIWPVEGEPITIFDRPDPIQACRAIHSHGAMVLRVTRETMVPCPASMPIVAIEPIRERAYPGRLLLIREPLANFAITLHSWRSETADENMQMLVLLAMTFMATSPNTEDFYARMWDLCRGDRGHKHRVLVVAGIKSGRLFSVIRGAAVTDLVLVAGWALLHPRRFVNLFAAARRFPDVYAFLAAPGRNQATH